MHLILLRFTDAAFLFLFLKQTEGNTPDQGKNHNSLACSGLEGHWQYLRGRPAQ